MALIHGKAIFVPMIWTRAWADHRRLDSCIELSELTRRVLNWLHQSSGADSYPLSGAACYQPLQRIQSWHEGHVDLLCIAPISADVTEVMYASISICPQYDHMYQKMRSKGNVSALCYLVYCGNHAVRDRLQAGQCAIPYPECSCAMLVCALNTSDTAMQEPVTCHNSQGLELIWYKKQ